MKNESTWPVVGGEYPFHAGSELFARVTAIDGDVVHFVYATKDKVEAKGRHCFLSTFRESFCPEDQSPIPKLVEALKDLISVCDDLALTYSVPTLFIDQMNRCKSILDDARAALKGVR